MGISEKGKKTALFIKIFCTYCQCVLHNVAKFYNVPCYVSSISATMIANSRLMTDWGNRRNWNHAIRSYLPFVINEDFPGFQLASDRSDLDLRIQMTERRYVSKSGEWDPFDYVAIDHQPLIAFEQRKISKHRPL